MDPVVPGNLSQIFDDFGPTTFRVLQNVFLYSMFFCTLCKQFIETSQIIAVFKIRVIIAQCTILEFLTCTPRTPIVQYTTTFENYLYLDNIQKYDLF